MYSLVLTSAVLVPVGYLLLLAFAEASAMRAAAADAVVQTRRISLLQIIRQTTLCTAILAAAFTYTTCVALLDAWIYREYIADAISSITVPLCLWITTWMFWRGNRNTTPNQTPATSRGMLTARAIWVLVLSFLLESALEQVLSYAMVLVGGNAEGYHAEKLVSLLSLLNEKPAFYKTVYVQAGLGAGLILFMLFIVIQIRLRPFSIGVKTFGQNQVGKLLALTFIGAPMMSAITTVVVDLGAITDNSEVQMVSLPFVTMAFSLSTIAILMAEIREILSRGQGSPELQEAARGDERPANPATGMQYQTTP